MRRVGRLLPALFAVVALASCASDAGRAPDAATTDEAGAAAPPVQARPPTTSSDLTAFFGAGGTTVFIHGAGDDPLVWADDIAAARGGFALNWAEDAARRLRAPARGYRLGRALVEEMGRSEASDVLPETITLVAHSAGAWVAQGIIDGIRETSGSAVDGRRPRIELHFLDPFTARSLVQPFAGGSVLGRGADVATTWYTTVDPIPFTAGRVAAGERIDVGSRLPEMNYRKTYLAARLQKGWTAQISTNV